MTILVTLLVALVVVVAAFWVALEYGLRHEDDFVRSHQQTYDDDGRHL